MSCTRTVFVLIEHDGREMTGIVRPRVFIGEGCWWSERERQKSTERSAYTRYQLMISCSIAERRRVVVRACARTNTHTQTNQPSSTPRRNQCISNSDKEKKEEQMPSLVFLLPRSRCLARLSVSFVSKRTFGVLLIYSSSRHILTFETNVESEPLAGCTPRIGGDLSNLSRQRASERGVFMDDAIFNLMPFELSMFDGNTHRNHDVELIEIV